jgi:hypothetical protein
VRCRARPRRVAQVLQPRRVNNLTPYAAYRLDTSNTASLAGFTPARRKQKRPPTVSERGRFTEGTRFTGRRRRF